MAFKRLLLSPVEDMAGRGGGEVGSGGGGAVGGGEGGDGAIVGI